MNINVVLQLPSYQAQLKILCSIQLTSASRRAKEKPSKNVVLWHRKGGAHSIPMALTEQTFP